MTDSPVYLRVAVPMPSWTCFDYLPPEACDVEKLQPGIRVRVPLGRRKVVGIVMGVSSTTNVPVNKCRHAIESIDDAPLLPRSVLRLLQMASDYYHHPIGEVVLGTLPKALRAGKVAALDEKYLYKLLAQDAPEQSEQAVVLNADQQQALDAINTAKTYATFLLEGVTGSGKTEVYLQAIAQRLAQGLQALVLVPEIALTPQTVQRFKARFSVPVICLHSGLTDKQRTQSWLLASQDAPCVVIGTRSALFVPLPALGLVVVDEEHDTSFKQQSGFRYSARDLAVLRANLEKIPVILGSATPSLESLHNAKMQKYTLLALPNRAGKAQMPTMSMINLCGKKLVNGLSPELIDTMKTHLAQGNQVLLFLNRRGFAPVMLCHQCGHVESCTRCVARLTYHHQLKRLQCHHCGYQKRVSAVCTDCHQSDYMPVGLGTERIENTLNTLFPEKTVLRIDRDTVRGKKELAEALTKIHDNEANILIGTQMLAKGHHFPALTLVAVLDADAGLFSIDFRAQENMAQLILQVAGRAGREHVKGEVVVQTHHPEHPFLQQLMTQGYAASVDTLMQERQQVMLPPFGHIALLRADAQALAFSLQFLKEVKAEFESAAHDTIQLLGPIASPMEKRAGRFRAQLMLQTQDRAALQALLSKAIPQLKNCNTASKVRWSLDVDPTDLL